MSAHICSMAGSSRMASSSARHSPAWSTNTPRKPAVAFAALALRSPCHEASASTWSCPLMSASTWMKASCLFLKYR